MTTSHQLFDVTVEHLLILSPEAVLNNQVPISEYIYCQIIQYRGKFQDWPSDVEYLDSRCALVFIEIKLCQNVSRSEGCYLSLLENNYWGYELCFTWANHWQCKFWCIHLEICSSEHRNAESEVNLFIILKKCNGMS